ncbi:MAG: glycosyltransferase [Ruminococcus sp.]|nr:glycosyltransferase [Ruminococcus sp.]
MPELSIIVPVYKVEKYLPKCIDSILAQTFTDFELILIDDGSPDRCGEICDEYASKDSRIKVIHQKNQGVSAARNVGLDIAKGTYLGFVDPDDWIEPKMYDVLIRTAKEKKADVVVCGINYYQCDGTFIRSDLTNTGSYNTDKLLAALCGKPTPLGLGCVNKIFLRQKVCQIRFQLKLLTSEDWVYLFESCQLCKFAYKISDTFYNVLERPISASRNNKIHVSLKIHLEDKLIFNLAHNYSHELECLVIDKFLDNCIRYSNLLRKTGLENGKRWRWNFIKIRTKVLRVLPGAYIKKLISKEQLHGYIYAVFKD